MIMEQCYVRIMSIAVDIMPLTSAKSASWFLRVAECNEVTSQRFQSALLCGQLTAHTSCCMYTHRHTTYSLMQLKSTHISIHCSIVNDERVPSVAFIGG